MTLKKLKPGMTVYRIKKATGLAACTGEWEMWEIRIKEIDEKNERVLASGYADEHWYYKNEWAKWRFNIPE